MHSANKCNRWTALISRIGKDTYADIAVDPRAFETSTECVELMTADDDDRATSATCHLSDPFSPRH